MRRGSGGAVFVLVAVAAATLATAQELRPAVRDVTPPGITPAPKVEGPLERIPAPLRPPEPPRWWRFYLPETTDAATFVTQGRTIRLSGVVPPPVEETCRNGDGTSWPCGRMALTSLRMFLRGRAVECFYPLVEAMPGEIVAPCRVGPTDIADWLLTQGWATPSDLATDGYRRDADQARCARVGLWRGAPQPDACPHVD
jgi:endonuclease YncB( thermonuclease family)